MTMTDSPNWKGLSRWRVVASYAISVAAFLGICLIAAGITGFTLGNPWYGLLAPIFPILSVLPELEDMMGAPLKDFRTLRLLLLLLSFCPMLFQLLGLSGFVISLRRPDRWGWFVCGHVCLVGYYVVCMLDTLLSVWFSGCP